ETFRQFQERTGHTILERYGMTEIGMHLSNPLHGERRAGTVGQPLPEAEIRICDEQDQPVGLDTPGGLQVRGPNVFSEYWKLPKKTAEEFTTEGWFRTGDIAQLDANGTVMLVGRGKDVVISGGLNVYPKEVEQVLDALPGVLESAVIGVPHPDFGEAVTAVVVPETGTTLDSSALIAAVREQLAGFKCPKTVHSLPELPRNAMGKVQKNELRKQFGGG
ncbi:MAG TPA: malonyl-CoA synthase, partial [Candidatus Lambdaproteobacteria bacterium]|nr:malonyl-CoA synthase [Candidatus Lambdaproteobacteria bacterium]